MKRRTKKKPIPRYRKQLSVAVASTRAIVEEEMANRADEQFRDLCLVLLDDLNDAREAMLRVKREVRRALR